MAIRTTILMRDIEDENKTKEYTFADTDVVPAVLQLAVLKKEENLIPVLDKHGRVFGITREVEGDGRPAGYAAHSAFLRP